MDNNSQQVDEGSIRWLFFLLFLSCTVLAPLQSAFGTEDEAFQLRSSAIERIENYVDVFRRTADSEKLKGELELASIGLQKSATLFSDQNQDEEAALALVKLGDAQRYLNSWRDSLRSYQQAYLLATASNADSIRCKALLGQARTHLYGFGSPAKSLQALKDALPIGAQSRLRVCQFDAWDLAAQANLAEDNLVGALDSISRAFVFEREIDDDALLFYALLDRGDIYLKFAEKCDIEAIYESCLRAVEKSKNDYTEAQSIAEKLGWHGLQNFARQFVTETTIRESLILAQQAHNQTILDMDTLISPESAADVPVSSQFSVSDNPALVGLMGMLDSEVGLPPPESAQGAFIHAMLNDAMGDTDKATQLYLKSADLLEDDRSSFQSENSRSGFLEERVEIYYNALVHLLSINRHEDAFNMMERARSRVLSDLVASKDLSLDQSNDRALYSEYVELSSKIGRHQDCLAALGGLFGNADSCESLELIVDGNDSPTRGAIVVEDTSDREIPFDQAELEKSITLLQSALSEVKEHIADVAPKLTELVSSETASLGTLQALLGQDSSEFIAYTSLPEQLIIWHVSETALNVRSVFLPRMLLNQKIERLAQSLSNPEVEYDFKLAHELYLLVYSPVEDLVESDHIIISPHEGLNYVPFQALVENTDGTFLGEVKKITYTPNVTVLRQFEKVDSLEGANALAVADASLRYAPLEVDGIGRLFNGVVLKDKLISEAEFVELLDEQELVHLAIHGIFDSDEPLMSYLNLGADEQSDGRLTAAEMYGLSLDKTRLVTLSACESGKGKASYANETLGMMRGLIFSGAGSILLSMWKIDDEAAAEWMAFFYDAAASRPFGEAARLAIRSMLEKPEFRHPYYWSPFVIHGR